MASPLYQSIELLSQEKGIDPGIVVGAVEEAIALATRKFYKTQENMRGELNKETGEITAYIYKTVVEVLTSTTIIVLTHQPFVEPVQLFLVVKFQN